MEAVEELFATETMAELCARQGRIADAAAIFRRLLAGSPQDERHARWAERLAALAGEALVPAAAAPAARPSAPPPPPPPTATAPSEHRMPLVIRQPVRSGQVVYAAQNDLIVLAPVNPGAQLMADGNIHVYGPLRGRAIAGAKGCTDARIFCLQLQAELVGVDAAYLACDDIPTDRVGRAAQVYLQDGKCVIAAL